MCVHTHVYMYKYTCVDVIWLESFIIPNIQTNRVSGNHTATLFEVLRTWGVGPFASVSLFELLLIQRHSASGLFFPTSFLGLFVILANDDQYLLPLVAWVMDTMPRPILTWWTCSFEIFDPRIDDVYVWTFGASECASATHGALRLLCASLSHCFPLFLDVFSTLSGAYRMPSQTATGCSVVTVDIFRLQASLGHLVTTESPLSHHWVTTES